MVGYTCQPLSDSDSSLKYPRFVTAVINEWFSQQRDCRFKSVSDDFEKILGYFRVVCRRNDVPKQGIEDLIEYMVTKREQIVDDLAVKDTQSTANYMLRFGSQHKFDTFVERFIARLGTQPQLVEVYSTPKLKLDLISRATTVLHTPTDQGESFKKASVSPQIETEKQQKDPEFVASQVFYQTLLESGLTEEESQLGKLAFLTCQGNKATTKGLVTRDSTSSGSMINQTHANSSSLVD